MNIEKVPTNRKVARIGQAQTSQKDKIQIINELKKNLKNHRKPIRRVNQIFISVLKEGRLSESKILKFDKQINRFDLNVFFNYSLPSKGTEQWALKCGSIKLV